MPDFNPGPASTSTPNSMGQLIAGSYTYATLPSTAATAGTTAYTTDQGLVYWNGTSWASVASTSPPQTATEMAAGVVPVNPQYSATPFLDARRYGVVADGVTDNAVALTNFAAVLRQFPVTTGVLPGGNILCSSLTALAFNSTSGVTITGNSAFNNTVLIYTGTGTGDFINAKSAFGFSLSYCSVYHNNAGFTGNLINFSHDGVGGTDSQHNLLFRCDFGNPSAQTLWTATGIQLDKATLCTIENCDFGALLFPIVGQSSAGGSYSVKNRVINCQFSNYNTYAIAYAGSGWEIRGCNFEPNKSHINNVLTTNANTPVDVLTITGNTILDGTAPATCIVLNLANNTVEISGNKATVGGGAGVFLQANAIINGLSMRGNHIGQGNIAIQVANVAHHGWAINGNWFDTFTTVIDHPEFVLGINVEGNFPDISGVTYVPSNSTTGGIKIPAPSSGVYAAELHGTSNLGVMLIDGQAGACYSRYQRAATNLGYIGSADSVVTNPAGSSANFALQAVNGFDIAINGGTPAFHINSTGDLVSTRGVAVCLRATAIETRTSTTTLTNSTQLTYVVPGAGTFEFELEVFSYFTTAVTDGVTANVNFSGAFTAIGSYLDGWFMNGSTTTTGIQPVQVSATVNNALAGLTLATYGASVTSATPAVHYIKGTLIATATGTLAFAFAQSTNGVDTANLGVGSYMKVTQLS